MAIRTDFTPGEVLAAADVNDTFASKPTKTFGTAVPSSPVSGDLFFDTADTPPTPKFFDGSVFQGIGGGKILQVVRATDTTQRTTSSSSFVDASLSVTITPQRSTSAVLLITVVSCLAPDNAYIALRITDNSNNIISGIGDSFMGAIISGINTFRSMQTLFAYATPATTSATTFKLRFRQSGGGTAIIDNVNATGQLYAIEVSA